ncbi:hypothetical protein PMIN02_007405 [Paraphaeosphaeria minitans]
MRSVLLITTFALSVFTAAAPTSGGRVKRESSVRGKESRSAELPMRSNDIRSAEPSVRGKESRNAVNRIIAIPEDDHVDITQDYQPSSIPEVEIEVRSAKPINRGASSKREPINRGANSRREPEPINRIKGRQPEPINRINGREPQSIYRWNGRDIEDEDIKADVQTRAAIRNQGKRSVREKSVVPDEDIEARTVRPVKNQKRADEYDNANEDLGARTIGDMVKRSVREKTVSDDDDIETRAIRNEGKRSVREKTVSGDDIESRGTVRPSNKRTTDDDENIEAKRYAEAEPISRNTGSYRRDAEADPISRNTGSYRRDAEAEPGFTRAKPDHRREVEAEPLNRINGKKRTAEPTIPSQKRDASP